jgi:serine/threonine-protein kinase HipA
MTDVEVHIDLDGTTRPVGLLRRHVSRRAETVTFEYDGAWLADNNRFSIEPALSLTRYGANAKADAAALYRRMVFNVLVSNVDDHLRNHGFLWLGKNGWSLSPAYDLNPTPTDVKARILTTNIDLDEGTCSIDLVESVADFFGIAPPVARQIIREVGAAVADWRTVAAAVGARASEINRMAGAFEHDDLKKARAM